MKKLSKFYLKKVPGGIKLKHRSNLNANAMKSRLKFLNFKTRSLTNKVDRVELTKMIDGFKHSNESTLSGMKKLKPKLKLKTKRTYKKPRRTLNILRKTPKKRSYK